MRTSVDARRLGAILLVVLLALGASGLPLALSYDPAPERAHESVVDMDAGALHLLRGGHAWAATVVLVLVALHLARAHAAGRLRALGRPAAMAGLSTLALLVGAYFSGTILPWDQQGWEAFEHLQTGARVVGAEIGEARAPSGTPLGLLFYAHVLAVPLALLALVLAHVHRGSLRADMARVAGLLRSTLAPALIVLAAIPILAFALPPALGPAPIPGLLVTRPDWPFLWLVPIQDAVGAAGLFALPLAFVIAAALLARRATPSPRRRLVALVLVAGAWGALSVLGAM